MDGNGRWAKNRGRPRFWGHLRGAANVTAIIKHAYSLGIKTLTLYAFSTENWNRPKEEINILFKILKKFLIAQKNELIVNKIRFKVIGHLDGVGLDIQKLVLGLEEETKSYSKFNLNFAFGYGGRDEIITALNQFIEKNPGQRCSESEFKKYLMTGKDSEVDFLIRTGGDTRISNFLLWQIAYAELYFTERFWPDFSPEDLTKAVESFVRRERRFGEIKLK